MNLEKITQLPIFHKLIRQRMLYNKFEQRLHIELNYINLCDAHTFKTLNMHALHLVQVAYHYLMLAHQMLG